MKRRRYLRKHGHEPKNRFGESLFPVTVRDGLSWVGQQQGAELHGSELPVFRLDCTQAPCRLAALAAAWPDGGKNGEMRHG